jgi:DNA segregation ATPase FtsK/SpoIIIE-like protein
MATLEDLGPNAAVRGILPDAQVTVVDPARAFAGKHQVVSASALQRMFPVGYTTASALIDLLEERGVVQRDKDKRRWKVVVEE